jgi:DNA polymerase I-like protein with 3'-5' exonuclease and polymerase domains
MTNYLIQGSASEILKKGLVDAWEAGVFNELHAHITVHDENVVSIPYNKIGTEAAIELQRCMEDSYKEQLLVPMKVVGEVGPNWGWWKNDIWNEMKEGKFNRHLLTGEVLT